MIVGRIRRLIHDAGVDGAVFYTVMARGWTSIAGLITVLLVARFLSTEEQGYFYTFASLVALQVVFELGFSFVLMQVASHESARLSIARDGTISGDAAAHARLAAILQMSIRWYGAGALSLGLVLIPAGLYFFSSNPQSGPPIAWRVPWMAVAIAAACAFQLDPLYSFLEGCGFVRHVSYLRWVQALLGSLLGWIALATHHGLLAPACVIAGQVIVGFVWLQRYRGLILGLARYDAGTQRPYWRDHVWPFQWRIAVSWLSSYFIFQTFNPFLFAYQGSTAAAQMGMSLSFANSLIAVSAAWISTKAAPFGRLIAEKRYRELDETFFRALLQSTVICTLGALVLWLAAVALSRAHSPFAAKILPPTPLGVLLLASIVNQVIGAGATYLRAHKQEKLSLLSLSTAMLMLASNYLLAKTTGVLGMVLGYLSILSFINLGIGSLIFVRYRRQWHSVES